MKYVLCLTENFAFFFDWIIIIWSWIVYGLMRLGYGLNNPGFWSRQGEEIFSSAKYPQRLWESPRVLSQWLPDFFHEGKTAGA